MGCRPVGPHPHKTKLGPYQFHHYVVPANPSLSHRVPDNWVAKSVANRARLALGPANQKSRKFSPLLHPSMIAAPAVAD